MSFNENVKLDTSQIRSGGSGRGGPGGLAVGGGIAGMILTLVLLLLGINPGSVPAIETGGMDSSQVEPAGDASNSLFAHCKTGEDANRDVWCRMVGSVNSVQAFWTGELPRYGREWRETPLVLYSGTTRSACGTASNQVGPFYCPADGSVYIDADFFEILERQYGSSGGPLAQMYVVAHEYGHALQDQLGLIGRAQQDPKGPESGAVRIELMADCLGGVWMNHASQTADPETGQPFLKPLTENDVRDALSAAAAVGDDRIQQATMGRVRPENWTHGSADARQQWLLRGYRSGDLNQCDTFAVESVN